MVYVGVDVAKHTHYGCVMNAKQSILTQPFPFSNNEAGFDKFMNSLLKFKKNEIIVGLEATSVYGENLMAFLAGLGYKIALINPLETSTMRRAKIRNTKTDKIDSKLICKYLAQSKYRLVYPEELQMLQLRGLCRFRQTLKKSNARLKTQLVSYLDVCFPEYHTAFKSGIHGKGSYAVLLEFPSASEIARANVVKLAGILSRASRGKFNREKADMIKLLAKHSVASRNDMNFQIKQSIRQIQLIESQLDDLEKHICSLFDSLDSIIKTIPGIGALNGSMILSEIGDISRFSNPNKLIAFAGLDPSVSQSGNFKAKSTRMSKRGSSVLRYALINAAWNASLNNHTFKNYYDEKFAQKGRHYSALGHVAGKLTRVIFKMLKDNVAFNLP